MKRKSVFCDFDGTIAGKDVADTLIDIYSGKDRLSVEKEWEEGKIGSREYINRLIVGLEISREEFSKFLLTIPIDEDFRKFYAYCKKERIDCIVLSDGFDLYIDELIRIFDLPKFTYYANHLFFENGKLNASFEYENNACFCKCAMCKGSILRKFKDGKTEIIYIGDGLSDRCAAVEADFVFAKGKLYDYCISKGIRCRKFNNFRDILNMFTETHR